MKKISILLAAASLLALAGVIGVATAAGAKTAHAAASNRGPKGSKGPRGPQGRKGSRGPNGPTGPTGPTGHAGPAGPAGPAGNNASSGLSHFSKLVPFNGTQSLTIGQFTVSEVAGPTGCNPVNLINNSSFQAEVSIIEGLDHTAGPGQYVALPMVSSMAIAASAPAAGDVATFSGVLVNGSSSITGTAGDLTLGDGCLVSGTFTGS